MVKSIKIDSGLIELAINDDENKIIAFNPEDTSFAERFYLVIKEIHAFEQKHAALFESKELDELGLPANSEERIALFSEFDSYIRKNVNDMFGENAAEYVFGKTATFTKFAQLVEGVTPYFSKVRSQKTEKYNSRPRSNKASSRTKAK